MAISNFFPLFFFFFSSYKFLLNTWNTFKVQKKKLKKKVQIILQTSGNSVKEDMALLLGWCGRENRNVWSELVFCSMARPDLRNTFRERGGVWLPGVVFIGIQRSARQKPQNKTWYWALAVLISTPYLLEPSSSSPNPSQNCLNTRTGVSFSHLRL